MAIIIRTTAIHHSCKFLDAGSEIIILAVVTSGFTPLVLKELRNLTSLKEFYIEYDSICKVDLFDCLPSTLTHLTLSRCNISLDKFNYLMSTGTQKKLKFVGFFSVPYHHARLLAL